MKITFFKKENSFKKKDFKLDSNFYWKIAVGIAFCSILFAIFFGFSFYIQISREPVLPASSDGGQVPTVRKDRIEKALNYFSTKEQKSNEILNSPSPLIDPSL